MKSKWSAFAHTDTLLTLILWLLLRPLLSPCGCSFANSPWPEASPGHGSIQANNTHSPRTSLRASSTPCTSLALYVILLEACLVLFCNFLYVFSNFLVLWFVEPYFRYVVIICVTFLFARVINSYIYLTALARHSGMMDRMKEMKEKRPPLKQ